MDKHQLTIEKSNTVSFFKLLTNFFPVEVEQQQAVVAAALGTFQDHIGEGGLLLCKKSLLPEVALCL